MSLNSQRIVITGIGLTSPNGNSLAEYRQNLLAGVSGVQPLEVRYMGSCLAGVCDFDPLKYQKRKEVRVGTRAGSISIYLHRHDRARQCRDRERDLRDFEIQLRHEVLVALPQSPDRG